MRVGLVHDDVFLLHRAPAMVHPERPERLRAVLTALREHGADVRSRPIKARLAREDEILRVHTAGHLDHLDRTIPGRGGWLDEDTFFSAHSWDAARMAAGAAIELVRGCLDGEITTGLALVRPPGHHAEPDRAMGFCLLNNVAIAAAAARAAGCARVAIIDWDVHHGNGTQAAFYRDPTVLVASTHQWPLYPGTGQAHETGAGDGRGATVNVPLPAGSGDPEYLAAFDELILPAVRAHRPDLILVSAGYDAWDGDPLASMRLSVSGYGALTARIRAVADELCGGKMVCVLEGGYDLIGIAACVRATFDVLAAPSLEAFSPDATRAALAAGTPILATARRAIEAARQALTQA